MRLYYDETLSPRKACAVAKYLNAPVDFQRIRLQKGENRTPDYLAINPNGKVPTLVDGNKNLWEADAIICYLSQKSGSDLWPQHPDLQIEVLRWFSWNAQHFSRHGGSLYFEHIIKPRFGLGDSDSAEIEKALGWYRKFAGVLDRHLGERTWLVGERLTVADFSVAVTLPYAEQASLPIDEFPNVQRWHDQLNDIAAWREPFPAGT